MPSEILIPPGMIRPPLSVDQSGHRAALKLKLLSRDVRCRGCGCPWPEASAVHMHEGIVSKRDVMGWKPELRGQINVEANCILLCHDCNLGLSGKHPPPRARVLAEHVHMYGPGVVRWLRSLPFKAHPLRGLLESYP